MAGVLEERAAIEQEIAGRTVCGQLKEAAERNPDAPAYSDPIEGGWSTLTYAEARRRVLEIAAGFVALGLEPGEAVALMMVNRSEHVLADLGAIHAGAVPCSVYSTFAPEQVAFVADDVKARIAVLGGPAELARWEPVLGDLPELRKIIMLEGAPQDDRFVGWDDFLALGRERLEQDPAGIDARWRAVTADDILTVLYTSGTTGNPKGVPLTHSNVFFEVGPPTGWPHCPKRALRSPISPTRTSPSACSASTCRCSRSPTLTSAPTSPSSAPPSARSNRCCSSASRASGRR